MLFFTKLDQVKLLSHTYKIMLRLFFVFILAIVTIVPFGDVAAETGSVNSATGTYNTAALLLDGVMTPDIQSIALTFNQNIRIESVRIRVIDQATNESVKIASITGSSNKSVATILTAAPLTPGASYVLTITSALSDTNQTIKAGVDSIREFTVPLNIPGITLNAPANPSAVIAATNTSAVTPKPVTPQPVVPVVNPPTTVETPVVPKDVPALPVTGAPTVIMILMAGLIAYSLLRIRKKA